MVYWFLLSVIFFICEVFVKLVLITTCHYSNTFNEYLNYRFCFACEMDVSKVKIGRAGILVKLYSTNVTKYPPTIACSKNLCTGWRWIDWKEKNFNLSKKRDAETLNFSIPKHVFKGFMVISVRWKSYYTLSLKKKFYNIR